MLNFVSKIFVNISSFVADAAWPFAWVKALGITLYNSFLNVLGSIWNFITRYVWYVTKWVLGALDAMQLAFTRLLGLDLNNNTSISLGEYIEGLKEVRASTSNYYDYLLKIFRAVFGVAIILMIIFTIISMVMQEYKLATNGYQKADNEKGKLFKILLKNVIAILLMPLIFYTLIVGTNAILTSFYRALGNYDGTTIAGNVLAASTYDANRYRSYANANKRIPITINVYSMENAFGASRSDAELLKEIQNQETQEILKAIGGAFAEDSFLPFEKSTTNTGGTWESYKNYSLTYNNTVYDDIGDYFENFICTREQYYVLADFVDYCQKYNIKYYVKAMSEPDICWKYVDDITATLDDEGNSLGDITLNVSYRNAESVNNPALTVNAATGADDTYSLKLTTKLDITSPISDALKTASTLLGVDSNTSKFNEMERDNSGDFTNLVSWATRKVFLKLSTVYDNSGRRISGFNINDSGTWNYSDQIIMYEYYRFQNSFGSTNNVFEDYTIEDLSKTGAKLDVLEMNYRNYNSNTKTYSEEHTLYCVRLNGTYYRVKESTEYFDDYGHAYFVLDVIDEEVNYFTNTEIKIKENGTKSLKLTGKNGKAFDINNSSTWGFTSQVLIYEYFKDLTLSNGLRRTNKFTDFVTGVTFNVYKINSTDYIYINGTYYAATGFGSGLNDSGDFLISTAKAGERYFSYKLTTANAEQYGINNLDSLISSRSESASDKELTSSNALYQKYTSMNMKFSENFSFYNSDTWTFRDYALIYMYINSFVKVSDNTITLDSMRVFGLTGDVIKAGSIYYLKIKVGSQTKYLNLDEFSKTSELKITSTISPDLFDDMNLGLSGVDLVESYNENLDTNILLNSSVSTKKFYLSENFDAFDPRTWTIGDYLLIYLTDKKIIDTDIEMIRIDGYSAVEYTNNHPASNEVFYRFGKKGDDKAFFLSSNAINEKGYTVEKWFNSNLMSYLMINNFNLDPSMIEFNEDDFAGGSMLNVNDYIYTISSDYKSFKSLQYVLARDLIQRDVVLKDKSVLEYSYANPELNEDDLATWNNIDLIIYLETGSVPTQSKPFKTYIYSGFNDDAYLKRYMKVGDCYVDIDNNYTKLSSVTNQIFSKSAKLYSSINAINNYYNTYFVNSVSSSDDEYIKDAEKTAIGVFNYYTPNLKGTGNAQTKANEIYYDFDIVLAKNGVALSSNGYYQFNAYKIKGEVYVKIKDDLYFCVSPKTDGLVYYKENSLIPGSSASNKAFELLSETYTSFSATLTTFDALLYSVLGSTESVEYKIYRCIMADNSEDVVQGYIKVNDKYIYYDEGYVGNIIANSFSTEENYKFLYSQYYSKNFVSSARPSIKTEFSEIKEIGSPSNMWKDGSLSSYTDWTGIEIILKSLGVENISKECKLYEAQNGKYYLGFGENYISLDGLVNVTLTKVEGKVTNVTLTDAERESLKWRLFNIEKSGDTLFFNEPVYITYMDVNSDYVSSESEVLSKISYDTSETSENSYVKKIASSNLDNWTLLGLFSAYADPENRYKRVYSYYYKNQLYFVFEGSAETYVIPYNFYETIGGGGVTYGIKLVQSSLFSYTSASSAPNSPLDKARKAINASASVMRQYTLKLMTRENGENYIFYSIYYSPDNYAVYNLPNATTASNSLKYLTITQIGTNYDLDSTTDISDAKIFEKRTGSVSQSADWGFIDFVIAYSTGATLGSYIANIIYVYDGKYYIKYDDRFIMISSDIKNFDVSASGTGIIKDLSGSTIIDILKSADLGSYGCVFDKSSTDAPVQIIENFEANKLKRATSGKLQKIDFSDTFDVRNYSTWKLSDYIIYYVFTNGYYGDNDKKYEFPFVYNPGFVKTGDKYYGLTYMDLVLAEYVGKNGDEYTYLLNPKDSYDLKLVGDSSGNYYLQYDYGKWIYISEDIKLNFSKMKVESADIDEILTDSDIEQKIRELKGGRYFNAALIGQSSYYTTFLKSNFQSFVNANGAPGWIYYLYKEDENTGSTTIDKVIDFSHNTLGKSGTYFKYDKFYSFYGSALKESLKTTKVNELDITISTTNPGGKTTLKVVYDQIFPDLKFDNNYYFNINSEILSESDLLTVPSSTSETISSGESTLERGTLNLRLSASFKVNDPSTWTVMDYIIIYEFSREGVRHNKFKDMNLTELQNSDYYTNDVYIDGDKIYLYINSNFYNISKYVELGTGDYTDIYVSNSEKINNGLYPKKESDPKLGELVSKGNINAHDFKTLAETLDLSINPLYTGSIQVNRESENISYQITDTDGKTVTIFKFIDTDIANANYRIVVSRFGRYSVKTLIKTVSWVEKLMNDMQTYYPDLNWGVLLATDGWLDTLGEFASAYTNGLYVSGQNSSNTTACGLVLSEFFMSVATEVSDSYADYEYSSVFDKETIQALMLSLMGEESYQALVFEAEVFMDYFNSCFAPIIDDFAEEFGEDVNSNSLRLCAYKSYLATLLLSSDIGEYLYTVATRVYAEYTIGEYLASAAGDYSSYYCYVNNLKDEEGNTIDSFEYASFAQLTKYENEYCGNNQPTFTFNFRSAFNRYKNNDGKISGVTYDKAISDDLYYNMVLNKIIEEMHKEYKKIYYNGYTISESGKVVDEYNKEVTSYAGERYVFCYMIHVYWSIKADIKDAIGEPIYLTQYKKYLDGELSRWNILKNENIDTADQYYETYGTDNMKMGLYKSLSFAAMVRLYIPSIALSDENDEGMLGKLKDLLKVVGELYTFQTNIIEVIQEKGILPIVNAYDMFENNTTLTNKLKFIQDNSLSLYFRMGFSEESTFKISEIFKEVIDGILPADLSTETSWEKILEFSDTLDDVISELQAIRFTMPGESTDNGCDRLIGKSDDYGDDEEKLYYSDAQIDKILSTFQDLKYDINQYITAQRRIDQMQKRSITFTLAQFGANYVSSGYEFSVRNKTYTFKSFTDPSRLAEYVYGGAFLEKVGVGAQYTAPEFEGIVKASKVYDNKSKTLKTNLDTWSELRRFASSIADETAEIYFLTNLGDLDTGKVNAVKITDSINCSYNGNSASSIEEMLIKIISEGIDIQIVNRLIDGKTTEHEKFVALALYIFSNEVDEEKLEDITFEDFKRIVLQKLIDNEQNESETPEERSARYMTLFNLMSLQVDFSAEGKQVGRIIPNANITRNGTSITYQEVVKIYGSDNAESSQVENYAFNDLTAVLSYSYNTQEVIKKLSGLENRPTREVLTRQYSGLNTGDYYDEAYGDTFIICTYKNGLYYPIIGSGSKGYSTDKYKEWLNDIYPNSSFVSDYYDNGGYVVVMKGIITADGYPTAVRKYNNPLQIEEKRLLSSSSETYNAVTFYRTNVGGNLGEGEDLIDASRAVSRVTTKNYTKYVKGTSFTKGIGSTTTYTGKTNLRTFVKADFKANFVQSKVEYTIEQADDFGAICVLDDFSYFYLFGGQTWVLLMLAFVTIIPVMINAVGAVVTRIFDLIILFLVSPLVISTNSLYPDGKNPTYKKWKTNMESVLLGVFGYIIGFSSFSIVVPIIYNIKTFVSVETFNKIIQIGGIGGFFSYPTINNLVRCLWVITAVSILERIPKMLLPIITANHGNLSSPDPGLGGGGKKFTDKAKEVTNSVKKSAQKLGSIWSGKAMLGLMQEAKDTALSMIPGYDIAKGAKQKFLDPVVNKAKDIALAAEQKAVEALLTVYGVDPTVAKAAGAALKEATKKQMEVSKKNKEQMQKYKEEFKKNFD